MFNIGLGEMLLLAVLGLLVFGPDRLPEAVSKGMEMLRQLREMATNARNQITDAAGIDGAEATKTLNELRDLHPRRLASSVLDPEPTPKKAAPSSSTDLDPDLA